MVDVREQPRVVLIFGDTQQGKSYLADLLHLNHYYCRIRLDEVYLDFVKKARYPEYDRPDLHELIKDHYHKILEPIPGAAEAWQDRVASITEGFCRDRNLIAVEGYLLRPALDAVKKRLAGRATVTIVEVRSRQYFIAGSVASIGQILG